MNDNSVNPKEEVRDFVERKIAEAKLMVAEKRLYFVLGLGAALITVSGIIIPMIEQDKSSQELERAVARIDARSLETTKEIEVATGEMKEDFRALAGTRLLKPKLDCFLDGHPLRNSLLVFGKKRPVRIIRVRNEGDKTAIFIQARLYLNERSPELEAAFQNWWRYSEFNDKPEFKYMLELLHSTDHISVMQYEEWHLDMSPVIKKNIACESKALLVIYYGQPERKEIPFTLKVEAAKPEKEE